MVCASCSHSTPVWAYFTLLLGFLDDSGFSEVYADPEDTVNDEHLCSSVIQLTKGIGQVPA